MGLPVIQPSFAAGEIAPALYARVDLAKWHVGASVLHNFFVDARGGASNRAGTQFIGPCAAGINRLIPFTFSVTQTYALLFSDLQVRFVTNGGMLLETAVAITGANQANPCQVTAPAHGFSNGDLVFLSGVGGMTRLNSRYFIVQNSLANTFTLQDWITGLPIDSTAYAAYTAGGTASRVYTLASPYAQADLALLKFIQSADTLTLVHPNYQPRQLKRLGAASWAFSLIAASAGQGPPTGLAAVAHTGGAGTTYRYVATAVTASGVESPPCAAGATTTAQVMSTTATEFVTVTFAAPAQAPAYYRVYRQIEVPGGAADPGEIFGFVGTTTSLTFVDHNISPDFTTTPPITFDPFAGSTWPSSTTYHQGRQVFAGATAQPETMNFSKSNDFLNFSYSTPSQPSDGIVATIASRQVNAIKHMVPMQSLLVLSASGAWRVDGGSVTATLTPQTIEAVPQAFNGCSDVPPITVNYDILYVQAKGSVVRDLAYNFYVNVYTGSDMTVLSSHLFFGHQILEWAWAEEPWKLVWCVREDGVLLSFTYLKEQDIYAWAHHETIGQFKSICSIAEGNEDAVYHVVQRTLNGGNVVSMVERFASRNLNAKPDYDPPVPADLTKAWFADCALRSTLTTPSVTLTPTATGRSPQPTVVPSGSTVLPDVVYTIVGVDPIATGAGYSNTPIILVTDAGGTGTGAQLTANVVGGAITSYNVVTPGQNYQQPVITIKDPTGVGAVAQAIISNDVVMNASGAHGANVGDMLRVNDGWGTVRVVNSATQLTVNIQRPLSRIFPAMAGAWSCTTPRTTFSGLDHLEGQTVCILADGNVVTEGVQNPTVVTNGAVVLGAAASDVLIGLPYKAQLGSLYADIPGEQPTAQGRRKQIAAATVRVADTVGLKVGHRLNDMSEIKERDFQPMGQPVLPITGDQRVVIGAEWDTDSRIFAEQGNPLPATILGLIPEVALGDTPSA